MNKTLTKAFMHRTKLKNKYIYPTEKKHIYKKQRNCVNLLNKVKKDYYNNLDLKFLRKTNLSGNVFYLSARTNVCAS